MLVLNLTAKVAAMQEFQYSVDIVTEEASLRNMAKLNYRQMERHPEEICKNSDGKPWLPSGEKPAMLISTDLIEAHKNRAFEK